MNFETTKTYVVDLDGTLIKTDLLIESFFLLLKKNILYVFSVFLWLLQGKARLKHNIAMRVEIQPEFLPYNEELLADLRLRRQSGQKLVLATASHKKFADAIANHLGIFERVLASDEKQNLGGSAKAKALVDNFGRGNFVYAGNAKVDFKVWKDAGEVVVVSPDAAFIKNVEKQFKKPIQTFLLPKAKLKDYMKLVRVHQWAKNMLVFVPFFSAHLWSKAEVYPKVAMAFFAFSFFASFIYIINDIFDLRDDRKHRSKKYRPLACAKISIPKGVVVALLLCGTATFLSLKVSLEFSLVMLLYLIMTTLYTLFLKKMALIDVVILSCLFTIRIFSGAVAVDVYLSFWIISFSLFLFISLALVKRYTELLHLKSEGKELSFGRGYFSSDMPALLAMGCASGYLSVMVFSLYIHSDQVKTLYAYPELLWGVCPILIYWISYIWLTTCRGKMRDDPIVFAMKNPTSLAVLLLTGVVFFMASFSGWL